MAGPSSFVTELKKFEKTLSFTIDPCAAPLNELKCSKVSTSLEQIMARWPTLVRSDEGMNKIIELVRSRLLDIGYLNMDPVTRIVEQASGVKVIIELMSYVPVRELDAANVKSHVCKISLSPLPSCRRLTLSLQRCVRTGFAGRIVRHLLRSRKSLKRPRSTWNRSNNRRPSLSSTRYVAQLQY